MSLSNDQLKDWFKDEFKDLKIRLSVNEDKSNEILRRLDVMTHETTDHGKTLYGKDGLLEQFTVLRTEHNQHMSNNTPQIKIAGNTYKTGRTALLISGAALLISLFKDILTKVIF